MELQIKISESKAILPPPEDSISDPRLKYFKTGVKCLDKSTGPFKMILQNKKTVYFISVPNIANIYIRINLLFGRFSYSERGILDKTHLRFFTLSTLKEFISDASLVITNIQATPIPLNMLHPGFNNHPFGRKIFYLLAKITHLAPTLLGYQFVVSATRI